MMTAKKIEGSAVIEVRISQKAARMANLEHYSAYLHNQIKFRNSGVSKEVIASVLPPPEGVQLLTVVQLNNNTCEKIKAMNQVARGVTLAIVPTVSNQVVRLI